MKKLLIALLMLVSLTLSGCRQKDTDPVIETTTATTATESIQTEISTTTENYQTFNDLGIFEDDIIKSDEINKSEDKNFWTGKSVFLEDICSEFYSPGDGSYVDLYKNPLPEVLENELLSFEKVFLFLSDDIPSYNIGETLCIYKDPYFNSNYILKSERLDQALKDPVFFFDRKTGDFYVEGINYDDRSLVKITLSTDEYYNSLSFSDFELLERNIDISNIKNDITALYDPSFQYRGTLVYDFTDKEYAFYKVGEKLSSLEIDIDNPYKFFTPIIDNEKNLLILDMEETISIFPPNIESIKIEEDVEEKIFDLIANTISPLYIHLYKKSDGSYFICEIEDLNPYNIDHADIKCYPISTDDMIFTLDLDKFGRCFLNVRIHLNDIKYFTRYHGYYLGFVDKDKRDDPIFHSDFTYTYDEIQELQELLPIT